MSLCTPPTPPCGWCMMISAWASAPRLLAPQACRNWPIGAASPVAIVATSGATACVVS